MTIEYCYFFNNSASTTMIDISHSILILKNNVFESNFNSPILSLESNLTVYNLTMMNIVCDSLLLGCGISLKSNSYANIDSLDTHNIISQKVNPGLIYSEDSILILNSSFCDNMTSNGRGSCIYSSRSNLTLLSNHFNSAFTTCLYFYQSLISIQNISITNGFFSAIDFDACPLINISGSYFANNKGNLEGGVLYINCKDYHNNEIYTINNCIFRNNSVNINGGAIFIFDGNVLISNSFFIKNTAKYGGAIFFKTSSFEIDLLINSSNFTENRALIEGGAIKSNLNSPKIASDVFCSNNYAYYGENFASFPIRMDFSVFILNSTANGNLKNINSFSLINSNSIDL